MKDENYKNGYHDGYAEALIALRAMIDSLPYDSSDLIAVKKLISKMMK